jgi:hypothetical protein
VLTIKRIEAPSVFKSNFQQLPFWLKALWDRGRLTVGRQISALAKASLVKSFFTRKISEFTFAKLTAQGGNLDSKPTIRAAGRRRHRAA